MTLRPHLCDKIRYRNRAAAIRGGLRLLQDRPGNPPLWVYRCGLCNRWHLTRVDQGGQLKPGWAPGVPVEPFEVAS